MAIARADSDADDPNAYTQLYLELDSGSRWVGLRWDYWRPSVVNNQYRYDKAGRMLGTLKSRRADMGAVFKDSGVALSTFSDLPAIPDYVRTLKGDDFPVVALISDGKRKLNRDEGGWVQLRFLYEGGLTDQFKRMDLYLKRDAAQWAIYAWLGGKWQPFNQIHFMGHVIDKQMRGISRVEFYNKNN